MDGYAEIARRLHAVRRAWRRTAVLSGCAVGALEALGLFSVVFHADALYRPAAAVRLGALICGALAIVGLFLRYVFRPLTRKITDEQLALFVEEHDDRFEGALIAAAEFHRAEHLQGRQAAIVDSIIAEAAQRARHINIRTVLDFTRLRKYGVALAVVLACYAAGSALFPETVAHHASRVLRPWRSAAEQAPGTRHEDGPVAFVLSEQDTRLLRGTPFELTATLSRTPDAPVLLHFRPAAEQAARSRWRTLAMEKSEKLHTFRAVLPDVTEDILFFVSAGTARSATHVLTVYDPLVLDGIEVTTRFPAYMELDDEVALRSTADVTAPYGAVVTLRILTNSTVAGGTLSWKDGTPQPLRQDPVRSDTALASFTVEGDASFTFRVRDIDGQSAAPDVPAVVRAVEDRPPGVTVRHPASSVTVHPVGEVTFVVDATDDYGVASVELVCRRLLSDPAGEQRLPLAIASPGASPRGNRVRATLNFRLEDLRPRLEPETSLAYHIECRDRKGQTALTDVALLTVDHFDTWATWEPLDEHPHDAPEVRALEPYLNAAWHLHKRIDTLSENDLRRQSEELADSMVDPDTGELYTFAYSHNPDKQANVRRATDHVVRGHAALEAHDTGVAVDALRMALAEIATFDLAETQKQEIAQGLFGGRPNAVRRRLEAAALEVARVEAEIQLRAPPPVPPDGSARDEQMARAVGDLEQQQQEIVAQARQLADGDAEELARRQAELANKTRDLARDATPEDAGPAAPAQPARELDRAAADMNRAAQRLRQGEAEQALAAAERAHRALRQAVDAVGGLQQAEMERVLDALEARTERLVETQRRVRAGTEAVAEAIPPGDAEPGTTAQRDLRTLAAKQVRLKAGAAELWGEVRQIRTLAESSARPETAKHIETAYRAVRLGRVEQKMTTAVVEIAAFRPKRAAGQQRAAEEALDRALDAIRSANDSLASDIESELRRAGNEARRIEAGIEEMSLPGAHTEARPRPAERDGSAERLAYDFRRFANHVADRGFAAPADLERLQRAAEKPEALARRLAREERQRRELLDVVRRVRNKLEAEYQATLAAKTLFDAQREDCPPAYRPLVNRYFEALSQSEK